MKFLIDMNLSPQWVTHDLDFGMLLTVQGTNRPA
jgi:predicted nuclease of predicted toxin-antitoxin system